VRLSAKADYAVRAALELAGADGGPLKGERIAEAQDIPLKFLENIMLELRHADLVRSQRGPEGGYRLARAAGEITVGEVIRAVDGPLASVRGQAPEEVSYADAAESLQTVWIALRAAVRSVVDTVTLADVASGTLPKQVVSATRDPDAWVRR
jgi:Rrf2 family protein